MTFQYTDKQLSIVNQGQNVYSVHQEFVNRINFAYLFIAFA